MLNEVKHLAYEREIFARANGAFPTMPRSFAVLRMTESVRGIAANVSRTPIGKLALAAAVRILG
jgi:hypothetical protein